MLNALWKIITSRYAMVAAVLLVMFGSRALLARSVWMAQINALFHTDALRQMIEDSARQIFLGRFSIYRNCVWPVNDPDVCHSTFKI